ncbi:B3 domain-containing transcription factor VRN1 isoform X2 [Prunus persica]|uniref:B3 domain-containing transcription factor VRN1 isoform X2 n=1 Tax=Prunus persica TaxID=3760 RepID=UPI0009AB5A09|nr:B3 domain-containing transcription factor VRN1 isoform X2 [Prunus persica]
MASLHDPPTFSASIPHFFKIILEDSSKIRIKIPMRFLMKYGENLSSPVHLKLPNGAEMEIELRRCNNGGVWFDKGWPEFSKFCSLDYGSWLVFGYEGNSNFHVLIFDRTATEIEYPKPEMEETDSEEEEEEQDDADDGSVEILDVSEEEEQQDDADDESVENLDVFPPCPRKAREKSPLPCPQPHKKMRTRSSGMMLEESLSNKASYCSKSEMKREKSPLVPSEVKDGVGRMHISTTSGKAIALQRAIAFKSVNPSFRVVMQPWYVKQSFLPMPSGFAKRHLIEHPAGNVFLRVSDGRTWSVKFKYEKSVARFQYGWLGFVRDNNLEADDVCVFSLIEDVKLSFDVVFFRTTEEAANCLLSPGRHDFPTKKDGGGTSSNRTGKATALDRANAFRSQNPSFIVSIRPSYINHWSMWLPSKFYKLSPSIKHSCEVILQVSNGRTWSVGLSKGRPRFRRGWMDVVRDNHLEVGDLCLFVLISSKSTPLFDLVIFRSGEGAKCTNDGEQIVPTKEETDNEDGDSSDDSSNDSSDDSVEIMDKFPPPRKTRVVKRS